MSIAMRAAFEAISSIDLYTVMVCIPFDYVFTGFGISILTSNKNFSCQAFFFQGLL
jgi:hypothetical protein